MDLIKYFRKEIKPSWASLCTAVYTDKAGRKYYKYNDELDMCISRKGEIDKCFMELSYGKDYLDIFHGIKKMVGESDKRGNMAPDIAGIGYLAEEVIMRDQLLVIPDILMRVCANTLIREDENPYIVDEEILEQKLITFKTEVQRGGLHGFFQVTGLLKSLNLSSMSITAFNNLMTVSEMTTEKQAKIRASIFASI